jgi:hypothetical protein
VCCCVVTLNQKRKFFLWIASFHGNKTANAAR